MKKLLPFLFLLLPSCKKVEIETPKETVMGFPSPQARIDLGIPGNATFDIPQNEWFVSCVEHHQPKKVKQAPARDTCRGVWGKKEDKLWDDEPKDFASLGFRKR